MKNITNDNDSDEIIACFHEQDIHKIHTGKLSSLVFPLTRREAYKKGIPIIIVRVYAFTHDIKFLIQKRSWSRNRWPGLFIDSASGHVSYQPNFSFEHIIENAWRELSEEMGTSVIYGRLLDFQIEHNREKSAELVYNFIAIVEDKCKPNLMEVDSDSGFRTLPQLEELLLAGNFWEVNIPYWSRIINEKLYEKIILEEKLIISNDDPTNFNIGSIIGRFQPFHNGHLKLILHILDKVKFLKIGIGSSQYSFTKNNPFSFEERKKMIVGSLEEVGVDSSHVRIYPIPDMHNIDKWIKKSIEILEKVDIFYSNNEYIRQIFLEKGFKIGEMNKYNFSLFNGTEIRNKLVNCVSISKFVPLYVKKYIDEIKGSERIITINTKNLESNHT